MADSLPTLFADFLRILPKCDGASSEDRGVASTLLARLLP
eukprot:CAMPEP_0206362968 /NCGR_PEP_ID=MMETSP0294-20121207/1299_1 /ASSEMBLY_ACC=CAM_ASM_000327 /TAXON_ID=39354 /ORGANISM="Heterosigma akashiwo, Strain CCMP2393" /LENGTH=39 /DNA_ID= /DNA_START= /DNA_END= /DNA_ORIENTATION=